MVRLRDEQRTLLADKVADLANLAAAGLVFGQALAGARFSVALGITGLLLFLVLMAIAVGLRGMGRWN